MDTDCTLLVSSYDGGEDLWPGFFTALTTQWPELDLPIVLNTESKSYSFPGLDIKTFSFYPGKPPKWGERLIKTLQNIDTEYVLFLLDDYWLTAPVDDAFFRKCLDHMRNNPDVATISFKPTYGPNIQDGRFERFERRPQKPERRFHFRLNCQAAIWRRERFIEFIRPFEDPWQWERYGSMRSTRYPDAFYALIKGEKEVFPYDNGDIVHLGRWDSALAEPLWKYYGLTPDLSVRGTWDSVQQEPINPALPYRAVRRLRTIAGRLRMEIKGLRSWLFN